jgi:hypothetical protein
MRCPDCDRPVSDLAICCPDCARPIAALLTQQESPEVLRPEGSPSEAELTAPAPRAGATSRGADPSTRLALAMKAAEATKQSGFPAKVCSACGVDVAVDLFREKRPDGSYRCADCSVSEEKGSRARREVLAKVGKVVALLVLFVSLIALGLVGINQAAAGNASGRRK